jgi:Na+/H+ antiporter NhaD/arsenite permease-like protein
LVLDLVVHTKRIPYLLAIAIASNISSTTTITGNPSKMLIGVLSHTPNSRFAAGFSPMAAFRLMLTVVLGLRSPIRPSSGLGTGLQTI